jgi:hypothetical protein
MSKLPENISNVRISFEIHVNRVPEYSFCFYIHQYNNNNLISYNMDLFFIEEKIKDTIATKFGEEEQGFFLSDSFPTELYQFLENQTFEYSTNDMNNTGYFRKYFDQEEFSKFFNSLEHFCGSKHTIKRFKDFYKNL